MSFKLLAAASLYDPAKLVEYTPEGERGERTDIGRVIHRVYYGGYWQLNIIDCYIVMASGFANPLVT
jgi:hypothetical protein